MRIPLILDRLRDILKYSQQSPEKALQYLGTAEFLLDFLLKTAVANKIGNITGVKEKIRDIQDALYISAGLLNETDGNSDPMHYARQALDVLSFKSLLGEKEELLRCRITNTHNLLHE
jgi:hypothetical protein